MKHFITSLLLLFTFLINAQEYNQYLLKKINLKGKLKGTYYLVTDENILGELSYDALNRVSTWHYNPKYSFVKEEKVAVYLDKIDITKANLQSLDTAGVVYKKFLNNKYGLL